MSDCLVATAGQRLNSGVAAERINDLIRVREFEHGTWYILSFLESQLLRKHTLVRNVVYAMVHPMNAHSENTVADRCIRLRKAMGYDFHGGQSAFAAYLGVPVGRWNHVERGMPLSKDLAFKVVQKCPGVTTEWLWFGGAGGLSLRMAQLLGEAPTTRRGTTTDPLKRSNSSS